MMSSSVSGMSSSTLSIIVYISMSSTLSSYLMELDTIARVLLPSVESYICQIVPDREESSIHKIREEKLIEHEDDSEWDDSVLMGYHVSIEPCSLKRCISSCLLKPCEYITHAEHITLLYHIYEHSAEGKQEKKTHKKIQNRIESRLSRLRYDKSAMQWKENSKYKHKIYWYAHKKYRKPQRKESTFCSEEWIAYEYNRKKHIYAKSDDRTESCLEESMKWYKIIEH